MNFQSLDLFSTSFQFNVGLKQMRKRSKIGAVLSIAVVATFLVYFVYLLLLYIGNQIDPKYKMQTFISEDSINIDLHNDILAFRYEHLNNVPLEDLEKQTGKKDLVYLPYFMVSTQDDLKLIDLDIIKCQNQKLQGYNCLDFSKVSNYTLLADGKTNSLQNILIFVYRCQDTDIYKLTVPDNCATPEDIDTMINDPITVFKMRMYTSQYNTTSEQVEASYKNIYMNIQGDDFLFTRFKAVKQTTVKKGPFIQQKTQFSSPIDYIKEERSFNRKSFIEKSSLTLNLQITIDLDEQVQIIQIQFATFMEILAICNSTLAILMGIGVIGRYFANQLIREDISLLLLQNLYQSQYLNTLKKCKIFQSKIQVKEGFQEKSNEDVIENTQQIFIPSFYAKSRETVDLVQNNLNQIPLDFVVTNNKSQLDKQSIHYDSQENVKNDNGNQSNFSDRIQQSQFDQTATNIKYQDDSPVAIQNYQMEFKDKISKYKDISQQLNNKIRIIETDNESQKSNLTEQNESPHSKYINKKNQLKYKKQSSNISSQLKFKQTYIQKSENSNTKDEINDPNQANKCIENLKVIQDQQFGNKFLKLLFKLKQIFNFQILYFQLILQLSFLKRHDSQINKFIDPRLHNLIDEQVNKNLDILQIYKDIIILKKAIMMLLSQEQFAAIQLVGFSNDFYSQLNINQKGKNQNIDGENQKMRKGFGHLDEQYLISQSLESQVEYIDKFLKRVQNNDNLTNLDQRILSSLTLQ